MAKANAEEILFCNVTEKEQREEQRKNTKDVTDGVEVARKKKKGIWRRSQGE